VIPIRRRTLVVLAVGLTVASWFVIRAVYGSIPRLDWWLAVPLGVLAVAEALGTRTLRARLKAEREARRSPERRVATDSRRTGPVRPVDPLLVARLAVLAQASAYAGAVFLGIWLGVLLYVAPQVHRLSAAAGDTVSAAVGVVCAGGLVLAALWLESACQVPPTQGDQPGGGVRA
jgi:hypothetical protein